ncbi:MAG: BACON domain-containing protein [Bacteroidales bacterium]|nr:BACON domain-containing protein [Bacteroidales bacterium]
MMKKMINYSMKTVPQYLFTAVTLFAALFSCQKAPEEVLDSEDGISKVIMRLSPFKGDDVETRTEYSFDSGTNTFTFLWAEGDAVGIVSSEGSQMKFPVQEQYYGQVDAEFDGRGFALISGSRYASYTPFIPDYDLDPAAVPLDYTGQVQRGDDNTSHLGDYGFSAAIGSAPSSGMLYFTYLNIGSPHRYRMPVLPGTYSSLTVSVDEAKYVTKGTFNLNADDETSLIVITPTEMSESIHLDLEETTMASVGNLRCWMMVAPTNLSGKVIRMRLECPDGTALLSAVAGADCPPNYRKLFSAKTSVYPAETEVGTEGGTITVQLINSATPVEVTAASGVDWITSVGSATDGRVTTYTFNVAENTGANREGTIVFSETGTSISNTVTVTQKKAGTIIGIGGWSTENHSGTAN